MMAGAIALMLCAQLPRVAFESEREKEQVLIDRGEQFIRAIQLYQLDNAGQWPQSLGRSGRRRAQALPAPPLRRSLHGQERMALDPHQRRRNLPILW